MGDDDTNENILKVIIKTPIGVTITSIYRVKNPSPQIHILADAALHCNELWAKMVCTNMENLGALQSSTR